MKIYTRTGDRGETSLFGGARVSKSDPRISAYGTVDELNAFVGAARAAWAGGPVDAELRSVQHDLFAIGAQLASPDARFEGVSADRITSLEQAIDSMECELTPLTNFILPGGTAVAAELHVARTVCRRAERLVVALGETTAAMETTVAYLNRLSDFFFVAARVANARQGAGDELWKR